MVSRFEQMALKFRDVLAETERLAPDELRAYQQKLLEPLLLHARQHSPFYRNRLGAVLRGDGADFSRWREIPVLTREQAQRSGEALAARMVPPHLGPVQRDETSGSTGRPLRYLRNELMSVAALAMTDRLYRWWGLDGNRRMASFVSPRRGLGQDSVTSGWRPGFPAGEHFLRETTGDAAAHVDWLARTAPSYFVSYSALVPPMAQIVLDRGTTLRLDAVVTRGGVVTPEMRELSRRAYGCGIADQYGADEIGQIACECPRCGSYHVACETVLLELLDEAGEPVGPGETGRVVLTNLYNYAMPLIRYEIGDYAVAASGAGQCGISLQSLERIIGRYRNVFRLADGRVLFPNMPMSGFRKFIACQQLQVVQTAWDRIEVRYVPDGSGKPEDERGLEEWMRGYLDPCFRVAAVRVGAIARTAEGKFEDFVSEIPAKRESGAVS